MNPASLEGGSGQDAGTENACAKAVQAYWDFVQTAWGGVTCLDVLRGVGRVWEKVRQAHGHMLGLRNRLPLHASLCICEGEDV